MHSRSGLVWIAAAGLLVGSSANAGSLTSATWSTNLQGIQVTITNSDATCADTATNHTQGTFICPTAGLGASGTASSTNYSVALTVPLFAGTHYTTGGATPIKTHFAISGGAATSGNNSSAMANQGVPGGVTVMVAAHAGMGVNASKFTAAMTTLVKIPLNVGVKGVFTSTTSVGATPHYITVDLYAWTPHTAIFTGLTTKFAPLPTVVAMGSFNLTAGGGGTVSLVSPSKIRVVKVTVRGVDRDSHQLGRLSAQDHSADSEALRPRAASSRG